MPEYCIAPKQVYLFKIAPHFHGQEIMRVFLQPDRKYQLFSLLQFFWGIHLFISINLFCILVFMSPW